MNSAVLGSLVGGGIGITVVLVMIGVANYRWSRRLFPGRKLRLVRRYLPLLVWEPK